MSHFSRETLYSLKSHIQYNLKQYSSNYDIILSDCNLEESNIKYTSIIGENIEKALNYYSIQYKKILLIIENNNIDNIFSILTKQENITLIDIYSGIFSYGKKSSLPKISPYSLIDYGFKVYNPIDHNSFTENMKNSYKKKYIQITDNILPEKLSKDEEAPIVINNTKGNQTLFITVGYCYTQIGKIFEKNEFKKSSLLILNEIILTSKSIAYIKESEYIIFIIDEKNKKIIKDKIESQLYSQNIYKKNIIYITPNYEKINTVFPEYQLQDANFDSEGIVKQIINTKLLKIKNV